MKRTGGILYFYLFCVISAQSQQRTVQKLISAEEINTLSVQWYAAYLAQQTVLDSANDKDARMVHQVAARIFTAAKKYYANAQRQAELKGLIWQVRVVRKKDVNAFCLPGARFVVGTGMLDWAQNEGSVAVVLAHELAHALQKSGETQLRRGLQQKMGGKSMSELLASKRANDAKDLYMAAFGAAHIVGMLPPYGLDEEIQADRLAMILAGLAGFNPRETIVFWERMDRLNHGPRQPVLMSAHPVIANRLVAMQESVDEIVKSYYKPAVKS